MARGRPQTSPHGKLFGGDSLYEVLAELAKNRGKRFSVVPVRERDVIRPGRESQPNAETDPKRD
jgi:uncharacterized LabA/DUF88 family protein